MNIDKIKSNLTTKGLLFYLSIGQFAKTKTDKKATTKVVDDANAERKAAKVVKNLWKEDDWKGITQVVSAVRTFVYEHTMLWDNAGNRLIPTGSKVKYANGVLRPDASGEPYAQVFLRVIEDYRNAFNKEADNATDRLTTMIENAKEMQGHLFNAGDYPNPANFRASFYLKYRWNNIPDTDPKIEGDAAFLKEIADSMQDQQDEVLRQAIRDVYERTHEAVKKFADTMADPNAGFHGTKVTNITDLMNVVASFEELLQDKRLSALRKEIDKFACSVDVKTLKEDTAARKDAAEKAAKLVSKLDSFLS